MQAKPHQARSSARMTGATARKEDHSRKETDTYLLTWFLPPVVHHNALSPPPLPPRTHSGGGEREREATCCWSSLPFPPSMNKTVPFQNGKRDTHFLCAPPPEIFKGSLPISPGAVSGEKVHSRGLLRSWRGASCVFVG